MSQLIPKQYFYPDFTTINLKLNLYETEKLFKILKQNHLTRKLFVNLGGPGW